MDWTIIAVNYLYAALGIVLMWVAYRLFDQLTPQVDFAEELKRGNVAVAIFIAGGAGQRSAVGGLDHLEDRFARFLAA